MGVGVGGGKRGETGGIKAFMEPILDECVNCCYLMTFPYSQLPLGSAHTPSPSAEAVATVAARLKT